MLSKSFHIVVSSSPYAGCHFKEALDLVLAACAFDRPTNLILEDDACYALVDGQNAKQTDQKNILQIMKALPIYGMDEVFVCEQSYNIRNLNLENCPIKIKLLSQSEKTELIRSFGTVIRF